MRVQYKFLFTSFPNVKSNFALSGKLCAVNNGKDHEFRSEKFKI